MRKFAAALTAYVFALALASSQASAGGNCNKIGQCLTKATNVIAAAITSDDVGDLQLGRWGEVELTFDGKSQAGEVCIHTPEMNKTQWPVPFWHLANGPAFDFFALTVSSGAHGVLDGTDALPDTCMKWATWEPPVRGTYAYVNFLIFVSGPPTTLTCPPGSLPDAVPPDCFAE